MRVRIDRDRFAGGTGGILAVVWGSECEHWGRWGWCGKECDGSDDIVMGSTPLVVDKYQQGC